MIDKLTENIARAIAANKRGLPVDDPRIDKVWSAYCGQARAALATARLSDNAFRRELMLSIMPALIQSDRDLFDDADREITTTKSLVSFAVSLVDALIQALPATEMPAA